MSPDEMREAHISKQLALLTSIFGHKITSAERYFVDDDLNDELIEEVGKRKFFSQSDGPLLIQFENGMALGFGSQPSLNSVTVWLDRDSDGHLRPDSTQADPELSKVEISDSEFSDFDAGVILQHTVTGCDLFVSSPVRANYVGLPNEQALVLTLDSAARLVIGHGLYTNSDDFRVLSWNDAKDALSSMKRTSVGQLQQGTSGH